VTWRIIKVIKKLLFCVELMGESFEGLLRGRGGTYYLGHPQMFSKLIWSRLDLTQVPLTICIPVFGNL
jgi:hypothetical protein